jgi:hypothetical protein
MFTIALTQGIKTKLYSILENGIELVRSLSKRKATILLEKLEQKHENTRSVQTSGDNDLQSNSGSNASGHQIRCQPNTVLGSSVTSEIQSISMASQQLQTTSNRQSKQRHSSIDSTNQKFRELYQQISNSQLPNLARRTFSSLVNSQYEQFQLNNEQFQLNNEQFQLNNEQFQLNNEQFQLNCQLASISFGLINTVNNMGNALANSGRSNAPTSFKLLEPTTINTVLLDS